MILSHVVAVSENDGIGVKNGLPWDIPEDLKFFKTKTLNSVIIMGRKTYESIGRPLPKRTTIVISNSAKSDEYPDGVLVAPSIPSAIELALPIAKEKNLEEIFIVGGGQIYHQSMDLVDRVYLTRVHLTVDADAYYPKISDKFFKIKNQRFSEDDKYKYTFYEYHRQK